jgi:cytochrome b561
VKAAQSVQIPERYDKVAVLFHWAIAAMLLVNVSLALRFATLDGPAKIRLIQLHKSLGLLILLVAAARLSWRLSRPVPAMQIGGLEQCAAMLVHK